MRETIKKPAEDYLAMLHAGERFGFARYGDGEILCMFDSRLNANCDGSRFLPELREPMKDVFRTHHPYFHALADAAGFASIAAQTAQFEAFLAEAWPDAQFYDGEIWQHLAFNGRISELMSALKGAVLVGGPHIANASSIKGAEGIQHIPVPARDAWMESDSIVAQCGIAYGEGRRVFGFAAGFASKPLICRLWPVLADATLIDLGSAMDPFCGVLSRSGMVLQGADWYRGFLK